jgi:tetratricopeptide (TPR) repeat protein
MSNIDSANTAQLLLQGMLKTYYQGTPPAEVALMEAQKFDTTNAAIWREFGVPYLKRGYYKESYYYYEKAVQHDPTSWQGWRGYNYLYFYRDFNRAIADFNALDTLTKNFSDYPQGQSVDYMRGIAYYGLGDYSNSRKYFDLYIDEILVRSDESWVDTYTFLYYGLGLLKENKIDSAQLYFNKLVKHNSNLADGYFHLARIFVLKKDDQKADEMITKAEKFFAQGSFHKRPYIEVLDQIYKEDIAKLKSEISHER